LVFSRSLEDEPVGETSLDVLDVQRAVLLVEADDATQGIRANRGPLDLCIGV
jgi:hypothetical protein